MILLSNLRRRVLAFLGFIGRSANEQLGRFRGFFAHTSGVWRLFLSTLYHSFVAPLRGRSKMRRQLFFMMRSVGVKLNHGRGRWRETLSLEYQREDFSIDNVDDRSRLLLPGASWSRTWGREFINVLDGVKLDFSIRGADQDLASDIDLLQYGIQLKFITSLGPRDRIIMRGAVGTIETDDFDRVPSSIRYYAGGSNSVRGYAYQSLGPEDDDGEAIGAQHLLVGSIEYEHYFSDRWGMAVFIDAGNALEDFDDDLEQGAGFGLRWKSPVGPVKVDLANAISDDQDWRLHFNIGPDL